MALRNIPQTVNDIYLVKGNDFIISSTGDLLMANGSNLSNQRIPRRLLTNPGDYIWHTDYGAGLAQYVGQPLSSDNFDNIKQVITAQIFLESSVAQNPAPEILLQSIQYGLFCQINYTLSPSYQPAVLTFGVER